MTSRHRLGIALIVCVVTASACSSFGTDADPAGSDGGTGDGTASNGAQGSGSEICVGGCPVAAYDFDEPQGDTIVDRSGQNNHGTLATASRVAGHAGQALSFMDANSGTPPVAIPPSRSLDVSGSALSIAAWLWLDPPRAGGRDQAIVAKPWIENEMSSPFYQYALEFSAGNARTVDLLVGDETAGATGASVTPPMSRWFHVAFVYDGTTVKAFLDGAGAGVTPLSVSLTARGTGLRLGCDAAGSQPFLGKLDELRIYDRALTPAEVKALAER